MNIREMAKNSAWRDGLEPGDKVAVYVPYRCGWGYRTIDRYEYCEIERITPKRNKFVMTNGREVERDNVAAIVPVSEETDKANKEYELRMIIHKGKTILEKGSQSYNALEPFDMQADKLESAAGLVSQLVTLLEKDT